MEVSTSTSRWALACVLAWPDAAAGGRRRGAAVLAGTAPAGDRDAVRRSLEREVPRVERELEELGWRWVASTDTAFPDALRTISDPPLGLFVRGRLPESPAVAVVGARQASAYGREVAEFFGRELAASGVWVVSGMARGVDTAAHRGALASDGPTAAIWGTGPDRVYPEENGALADAIAGRGGVATEYPPGTPPLGRHFPERNRIIAGLARVILVVEATERSGSLITARLALEEGREVMAVPGSVFSRLSAGPNGLLRAGAAPALTPGDVLEVLGVAPSPVRPAAAPEPVMLRWIPHGQAITVDELAARAKVPVSRALEEIARLELEGAVIRERDGRLRRNGSR